MTNALRDYVAVGLRLRQFDIDGLLSEFGSRHKVGQRQVGIRSSHDVNAVVGNEFVLHALRHAAEHAEHQFRLAFAAERCKILQTREDFLLSIVADGASVEKHRIGILKHVGRLIASDFHY